MRRPQVVPPIPPVQPVRPDADLFLVSRSEPYLEALDRVRRYARHPRVPVLLEGESGTGKTLFARHLHVSSPRAHGPFTIVNLAALDDALAGSELFGHVAGAFTGAIRSRQGAFTAAHGGTLFLDEIGRSSRAVQAKLLNAVEDGRVPTLGADVAAHADVRIVAATSTALRRLVADDQFLLDLWMRLGGCVVRIPALRERAEDIPLLVARLVERAAAGHGYERPPRLDDALLECLATAAWPGNVRQLVMAVDAMLLHADGEARLTLAHCDASIFERASLPGRGGLADEVPSIPCDRLRLALAQESGNKTRAAHRLGVSRTTLYRWLNADTSRMALEG